jgi:hypothetical protein
MPSIEFSFTYCLWILVLFLCSEALYAIHRAGDRWIHAWGGARVRLGWPTVTFGVLVAKRQEVSAYRISGTKVCNLIKFKNFHVEWNFEFQKSHPHSRLWCSHRYLAIPASSAPSERVFSACRTVLMKRRWAMDPSNLANLIFLKCNEHLWEEKKTH